MKAVLLMVMFAGTAAAAVETRACAASSGPRVTPLVEMYTSEGCSSCPPADRWLSGRFDKGDANFLAFHVDYWDDLGWPDPFGSAEFAERQRLRVASAGERTVYTPQVMVGEDTRVAWHRDAAWSESLREAQRPARSALSLRLVEGPSGWHAVLGAAPVGGAVAGAQLWLARHVDARSTEVRAGENRGKTLRHDRVVRELLGPWKFGDSPISREIDFPAETGPWGVTAFVQDPRGTVLQSLSIDAADCNGPQNSPRTPK